ncbi:MAG: prolyl oligopeptidase family serine peptidase [Vicinamibacterales bacterium]
MKRFLLASSIAAVALSMPLMARQSQPGIDDILNLERVGSPAVSPDGRLVAYTVRRPDWKEDEYVTEVWLGGPDAPARQLTRGPKSSGQPAWSPDGTWLAFTSNRSGKQQIYRLALDAGEAEPLTDTEGGVNRFAWSPDGTKIAYTMTDPESAEMKARKEKYGDYAVEDEDRRMAQLYVLDIASRTTRQLTDAPFVVGAFDWSPDGTKIAYDHRVSSDPADSGSADISVVEVASATSTVAIDQAGPDSNPIWSPDGSRIAFSTAMAKPFFFFENGEIAVTTPGSKTAEVLTADFDEDPNLLAWTKQGLFFSASQHTWAYLFRLDPSSKQVTRYAAGDQWIGSGFSVSPDSAHVAFVGAGPEAFAEIYVAPLAERLQPAQVSHAGTAIRNWPKHTREVFTWKSQDGAAIEGVLHKPADFQSGRRYPLLVVIHGGPTGVSRPVPYSNGAGYYPIDAFLAEGALVLEPNYRGSAGYGEAFRSLNVRNLGIGDAWDVLSGIDALAKAGLVDPDRVGSMGWSQGGYISAFLTTKHSERFKAISVGAGISDWMTYYVNTDIHPFTRQYLKATPWDDPKIYADTSPITYIKQANTPTLIQHKAGDRRVPIPNAYELYQGLRDQGVRTRLVVFPGEGHGITTPKANRAAMQQNLDWFSELLGLK